MPADCNAESSRADLAGQHHHRHLRRSRRCGQRADHLAVQGLVVELALTGDHQIGGGNVVSQAGVLGDDRCARFAPAAQREQRRPDPAGGPCARFRADRPSGGGVQFAGPLGRGALRAPPRCPDPHPSAARIPGRPPTGPPAGTRRRRPRSARTPASRRRPASRPPSSSTMPRPPSVLAVPPRPTTMRAAPACSAAAISWPTPLLCAASAVCGVGGPPSRANPHACAHSRYAVADCGIQHPLGPHVVGQRTATLAGAAAPPAGWPVRRRIPGRRRIAGRR